MKTYEEFINNILETRGRFSCGDAYHERHHIIPKCMGGSNNNDNLIDLYAREHFEAHRLLALENQENEKIVYAWWAMCAFPGSSRNREDVTPEEYEEARIMFTNLISGENSPCFGKHPSEETRQKMRDNHYDCSGENNSFYGKYHSEEAKEKMRMYAENRPEHVRKKISESLKGRFMGEDNPNYGNHKFAGENNPMYGVHRYGKDNPMYGKCQSEESKDKIRQSKIGKYVGENNPNARKIIRLSDLKIYDYGKLAAEDNGITSGTLCYRCNKHKNFMYYDEWLAEQENNVIQV